MPQISKALPLAILLIAGLAAGCANVGAGSGPPTTTTTTDQMLCESSRGDGVWVAAAGVCIRSGGGR